jgi:hypothetical protein
MRRTPEAVMIRKSLALVLVGLVAVGAAPAFAKGSSGKSSSTPAPATTPPAPTQTRDEEAVAFLMNLDNTKFKLNDQDAVTNIRKVLGYCKDAAVSSGAKSKGAAILVWFAQRKSSPVVIAAVGALGEIGKGQGTQKLVMILDSMMLSKDPPADQVAAVLGALRNAADPDPGVTRAVMKVIVERDGPTAAKAAEVLGNYTDAPVEVKKRLFEDMLLAFETMAAVKPDNQPGVDKWKAVSFPASAALGALSKQSFADIAAARKWFNEKGRDSAAWK